eukprot:Gb_22700 [translate_table: standard]
MEIRQEEVGMWLQPCPSFNATAKNEKGKVSFVRICTHFWRVVLDLAEVKCGVLVHVSICMLRLRCNCSISLEGEALGRVCSWQTPRLLVSSLPFGNTGCDTFSMKHCPGKSPSMKDYIYGGYALNEGLRGRYEGIG